MGPPGGGDAGVEGVLRGVETRCFFGHEVMGRSDFFVGGGSYGFGPLGLAQRCGEKLSDCKSADGSLETIAPTSGRLEREIIATIYAHCMANIGTNPQNNWCLAVR